MSFNLITVLTILLISPAFADEKPFEPHRGQTPDNRRSVYHPNVRMNTPWINGTGCSSGTSSVTLSPDQRTLSILFDDYVSDTSAVPLHRKKRIALRNCWIHIPFEVPKKMQFAIVQIDYRGYAYIPEGGKGSFLTTYRFRKTGKQKLYRRLQRRLLKTQGPVDRDFHIVSQIVRGNRVWSKCGENVELLIQTRLSVESGSRSDDALAVIDSADVSSRPAQVHLLWRACK